jgi:hypothetical protein
MIWSRSFFLANKSYDAIVIPRKDYFTFPSLWMPLQAGEIWDNTPKQCLGTEHNGGFADVFLLTPIIISIHEHNSIEGSLIFAAYWPIWGVKIGPPKTP